VVEATPKPDIVEVGITYHTKIGNHSKIVSKKEKLDQNGVPYNEFKGVLIQVVSGFEILLNRSHYYNGQGKWINYPGGIHDLSKKCDH
jgi:hypothetical protein